MNIIVMRFDPNGLHKPFLYFSTFPIKIKWIRLIYYLKTGCVSIINTIVLLWSQGIIILVQKFKIGNFRISEFKNFQILGINREINYSALHLFYCLMCTTQPHARIVGGTENKTYRLKMYKCKPINWSVQRKV